MSAKILIVEDDYANQQVATLYLKKFGYSSDIAKNGVIGVSLSQENKYGLILMDCQMPIMDGFTATKLIREGNGLSQLTPIIALTANLISGIKEECLECGMNDILNKPISVTKMKEILVKWFDESAK